MNEESVVLSSIEDGVLSITLNRPEKINALNDAMHLGLRACLEQAHADDKVRAVLLSGAGRGFCSGQDLADRDPSKREAIDLESTLERFYNPNQRLIRNLKKPIICAVNGVAAGAGANLALSCDIIIAARSAKFIQAFAKIGLIPDAGGTWMLPHLVGEARAKGLAMTALPLSAEQAMAWGLIWQVVEDDDLMTAAMTLAKSLASGATKALGLAKQAIQAAGTNSFEEQLLLESELQKQAGRSHDFAEGVRAFLAKRPPVFQGK